MCKVDKNLDLLTTDNNKINTGIGKSTRILTLFIQRGKDGTDLFGITIIHPEFFSKFVEKPIQEVEAEA